MNEPRAPWVYIAALSAWRIRRELERAGDRLTAAERAFARAILEQHESWIRHERTRRRMAA